jgi:hypothetical protein
MALKCVVVIKGVSIHISTSPSPYLGDVGRHKTFLVFKSSFFFVLFFFLTCPHERTMRSPSLVVAREEQSLEGCQEVVGLNPGRLQRGQYCCGRGSATLLLCIYDPKQRVYL